jgi:flavin reductase (DIM6/NTAB) family NADH-FMN oxidoreductase RutF
MQLVPSAANVLDVYHTMTGLVTPRPIAWVTTLSRQSVVNLAPFSFFNMFGANPPVVVFSPTLKRDGSKKDTLNNIEFNKEFVVNLSVSGLAEKVNLTSREIPPEQSEVELAGLHTAPSTKIRTPRVAESPAAMECKLLQIVPIGTGAIAANLVIGEVVCIHVADEMLDLAGRPDPKKLKTIARLGGDYWCHTSDLFELKRP